MFLIVHWGSMSLPGSIVPVLDPNQLAGALYLKLKHSPVMGDQISMSL